MLTASALNSSEYRRRVFLVMNTSNASSMRLTGVSAPIRPVHPAAYPGPDPAAYPGPDPAAYPGPGLAACPGPDPAAYPGPDPAAYPGPGLAACPGLGAASGAVSLPAPWHAFASVHGARHECARALQVTLHCAFESDAPAAPDRSSVGYRRRADHWTGPAPG